MTSARNFDSLGIDELPSLIVGVVVPLGIDPVLAPLSPIISMIDPDPSGSGKI
jgi:hypothetical protein